MDSISGIAASRGVALGPVFHFKRERLAVERKSIADTQAEWQRLGGALEVARGQLQVIYEKSCQEAGSEQAAIFEAHQMLLDDPDLLDAVQEIVFQQAVNCEAALMEAAEKYAKLLEELEDEYFRARATDIRDVVGRVVRILSGQSDSPTEQLTRPSIVLAYDLMPSDTAQLDKSLTLGFCTAAGGATSHTAILARSLSLPAIVGAGSGILDVLEGSFAILDGYSGSLLIDPEEKLINRYRQAQVEQQRQTALARQSTHLPPTTLDGHTVEVIANIGNLADAQAAIEAGAEGVGLFRTEFLYLEHSELPGEETQYLAYQSILDAFGSLPVILRTLDIGGDKELPYFKMPVEMNPFLGQRAIRLCLAYPELFKPQLRAALRAGVGHQLKVMFPMIATVEEVRRGREMFEACRAELLAEGQPAADNIEVGIMVEIPAAALMADQLAQVVDFFSIGTNDLCQYTLAADRTNAAVAGLTSDFQPAVLRLIKQVIDAGHRHGKRVGMCGEMAGNPLAVPILVGLGLDDFSMNPAAIPFAKQVIRGLRRADAEALADQALAQADQAGVQRLAQEFCEQRQMEHNQHE